jgi:FkbM family methyltransferase
VTDRRVRIGGSSVVVDGTVQPAFWDLVDADRWEAATVSVVAGRAAPGAWFVDVGAWIGPLTLLAAARGARVVAYEPDPVARAQLEANLARNPDLAPLVEVRPVALGRRAGPGRLDGGPHGLGSSLSRLVPRGGIEIAIRDAAAEAETEPFRSATLVKIDVEGAEHTVVPRLRRYLAAQRPPLLLSLHGHDLRARAERGRARRLRTAWYRLVGARRRLPVLWALRHYRTVAVAGAGPAASGGWRPLSRPARWLLAVRLADVELCCVARRDLLS